MKKSLCVLAVLASSCALYAQEGSSAQEVLSYFKKYNPAVLEKAQQDAAYNSALQNVVNNVKLDGSLEAQLEMIALVRNFDNSVKLMATSQEYEDALLMGITSESDTDPIVKKYRQEFKNVYGGIWAVSVNLQEQLLSQYKQMLKGVKKNQNLTPEQRAAEQDVLNKKIAASQKYLKQIKDNAGEYITSAANAAMATAENNVFTRISELNKVKAQMEAAKAARESDNLQVKNKNQKPVAK